MVVEGSEVFACVQIGCGGDGACSNFIVHWSPASQTVELLGDPLHENPAVILGSLLADENRYYVGRNSVAEVYF